MCVSSFEESSKQIPRIFEEDSQNNPRLRGRGVQEPLPREAGRRVERVVPGVSGRRKGRRGFS